MSGRTPTQNILEQLVHQALSKVEDEDARRTALLYELRKDVDRIERAWGSPSSRRNTRREVAQSDRFPGATAGAHQDGDERDLDRRLAAAAERLRRSLEFGLSPTPSSPEDCDQADYACARQIESLRRQMDTITESLSRIEQLISGQKDEWLLTVTDRIDACQHEVTKSAATASEAVGYRLAAIESKITEAACRANEQNCVAALTRVRQTLQRLVDPIEPMAQNPNLADRPEQAQVSAIKRFTSANRAKFASDPSGSVGPSAPQLSARFGKKQSYYQDAIATTKQSKCLPSRQKRKLSRHLAAIRAACQTKGSGIATACAMGTFLALVALLYSGGDAKTESGWEPVVTETIVPKAVPAQQPRRWCRFDIWESCA